VTADLAAPAEVKKILKSSCYDCHSNETKLAWFDEIVPAYWLVAKDVERARRRLNFSEIGKLPAAQQKAMLYEAANQIQLGAMPLPAYVRLHHAATVTPDQMRVLKSYLHPSENAAAAPPSDLVADDAQYNEWLHQKQPAKPVVAAPNGIEFLPDYRNWQEISSTDRFDNRTTRAILGNGVAIKAIAEEHINPWPDGAVLAKVAWQARDDGQGQVRPGAFVQVEVMIRDRKKYAATKGWGWARWRGAGLTPYGKDAGFTAECVGCHTPLRDRDYVFTVPRRGNAVLGGVITSIFDRRVSTMSTLYGNRVALEHARGSATPSYPPGSVLWLVSWSMQEDAHWFGGRIPDQVKSTEEVRVTDSFFPDGRAAQLLSLRAAVMP
jgi:hypothetical protein